MVGPLIVFIMQFEQKYFMDNRHEQKYLVDIGETCWGAHGGVTGVRGSGHPGCLG